MIYSVGVDVGTRNGSIAILDENMKICLLTKAPFREVEASHTSANRVKPKLNPKTGKYEVAYKKRSWTDYTKLRELFSPYIAKRNRIIYTVERVSVRPGEGEISSFIFGNSLGCFEGLSAYLNPLEMYEPTPNVWKSEMGLSSDKSASKELVEKIFDINLRDYLPKGKTDDIAEALLLALYGYKQYADNTKTN